MNQLYRNQLFTIIRHFVALILVTLLLTFAITSNTAHAKSKNVDIVPGQIVVKLDPATGATIDAINQTYGTTTAQAILASRGIYLLQTSGDAKAIAEQMAGDLRLLYAELNYIGSSPEDAGRKSWSWGNGPEPRAAQYAATMLNLAGAHAISKGSGIVVAVLDTGFDLSHPALASRYTGDRYDFVDDDPSPDDTVDGVDNDGDGFADDAWGHGTHVAGIVNFVAPEAQIMPLRVLDADGVGNYFTLAEAIDYAINHGAHVINFSLGSEAKSALLNDMVRQATLRGIVVVAAAGNLDSRTEQYPAADQCTLAITAVDEAGQKATFANYGGWVDLALPGVGIYSTAPDGRYAWWSGTSMATPMMAGEAALIRSVNGGITVRQIADLFAGTARPIDDRNPDYRGRLGAGIPDVTTALQRLQAGDLPKGGGTISGSCSVAE